MVHAAKRIMTGPDLMSRSSRLRLSTAFPARPRTVGSTALWSEQQPAQKCRAGATPPTSPRIDSGEYRQDTLMTKGIILAGNAGTACR